MAWVACLAMRPAMRERERVAERVSRGGDKAAAAAQRRQACVRACGRVVGRGSGPRLEAPSGRDRQCKGNQGKMALATSPGRALTDCRMTPVGRGIGAG